MEKYKYEMFKLINRFTFISFGVLLGYVSNQYLVGWYSIIFQSLMLTGLIAVTIHIVTQKK